MKQIRLSIDDRATCLCTFYNNGKANVMVIDSVYTAPAHRRQGYAGRLIRQVVDLAKAESVDTIELVVDPNNAAAVGLYKACGFVPSGKEQWRTVLRHFQVGSSGGGRCAGDRSGSLNQ